MAPAAGSDVGAIHRRGRVHDLAAANPLGQNDPTDTRVDLLHGKLAACPRRGGLSRARACGKPRAALLGAVHTGADLLLVAHRFCASIAAAGRLRARARTIVAGAFAGIFVLSFGLSIVETQNNQTFAYFNTFARLWEFCLGAWLAMQSGVALNKQLRVAFGWIGLAGIVVCGAIFQVSQVFPGYAALWPVGCAVLILMAGPSGSRFGVDRLLASRPLVYIGGISYGLYLWHWPVLVFYRWFTHFVSVGLVAGLGSSDGVDGARRDQHAVRRIPFRFSGVTRCHATTSCGVRRGRHDSRAARERGVGGLLRSQKKYDERPIAAENPDYPGARAFENGFQYAGKPHLPLYPGHARRAARFVRHLHGWMLSARCRLGAATLHIRQPELRRTLALVGGSHSVHWLPALEAIAKQQDWRIVVYTKSDCIFGDEIGDLQYDEWCREWNERTLAILLEDRPPVIFTTATRGSGAASTFRKDS